MTELLVWHFLPADGRLAREGTLVVPGQTLRLRAGATPELCAVGYHGSVRAIDALGYASGAIVERVVLSGDVLQGVDKACASERTCIAVADAAAVLFEFACWCAERALMRERYAGREPDARSWAAVTARRAWLRGEISDAQLAVAAWDAKATTTAARAAAAAAFDAWAAVWAAYAAAYAATTTAARHAAYAATYAARGAQDADRDAACATARDAESAAQNAELEARLCALLGVAV